MSQITVLGMGAMGSRMATNLLKHGHEVTVWNRTREKTMPLIEAGAKGAKTPQAAVKGAEIVIAMVRDDEASRQVWLDEETGALAGLSDNAIALESSTLTVAWTRQLVQHFQSRGIDFLEAPVVGSRPQAELAQLIYLVGGEPSVFAKVQPLLAQLGSAAHYAGSVGSGMATKLAINALFAIQAATMAELIGFLQGCGMDGRHAIDILTATPVCSPAAKALAGAMLARNFAPMFPVELVKKDLSYLTDTAKAAQATVPLGVSARKVFESAIAQGHGGENITGVAQLYSAL